MTNSTSTSGVDGVGHFGDGFVAVVDDFVGSVRGGVGTSCTCDSDGVDSGELKGWSDLVDAGGKVENLTHLCELKGVDSHSGGGTVDENDGPGVRSSGSVRSREAEILEEADAGSHVSHLRMKDQSVSDGMMASS